MAETAGLALGAVALVSLFQTAVGFLEYFEIARNFRADRDLATTKINLLEVRLRNWGRDLHLDEVGPEKDGWLHMQRLEEGGRNVITSCLIGISNILGNASELSSKYGLGERRKRMSWHGLIAIGIMRARCRPPHRCRLACKDKSPKRAAPQSKASSTSNSLGSKIVWAIKDKRRFEALIIDLDFLITNLERVLPASGSSNVTAPKPAPTSCKDANRSDIKTPDTLKDFLALPKPQRVNYIDFLHDQGQLVNFNVVIIKRAKEGDRSALEKLYEFVKPAQQGHSYKNCTSENSADQINGDINSNLGRSHTYEESKAKGKSLQANGNLGGKAFRDLLEFRKEKQQSSK